jgi:flavodoxin
VTGIILIMFSDTGNTEMVSSVCHPECNEGSLKDERFEVEINFCGIQRYQPEKFRVYVPADAHLYALVKNQKMLKLKSSPLNS